MTGLVIHSGVEREYPDCLRDESRRTGRAEALAFPRSAAEIGEVLAYARSRLLPVTVQGARTGITGGAVPDGGVIANLSRMARIAALRQDASQGRFVLTVEPGLALDELRKRVAAGDFDTTDWSADSLAALAAYKAGGSWFFPPDPTETSASIGGMVACNASGACSFHYGSSRRYVAGLRVLLADGTALDLRRGRERLQGRAIRLPLAGGRTLEGQAPRYRLPAVKNASGYYVEDDMDVVDLFIGSEGTLGIVTGIDLALLPAPAAVWGVAAFFPAEANAIDFVRAVRDAAAPRPVAIEFFDARTLALLRQQKAAAAAFEELPDLPPAFHTAVYVEYHGDEPSVMDAVANLSAAITACGGTEDATWIATTHRDMERLRFFRHAVPEAVNLLIDVRRKAAPGLTKLGTDMAVPDGELEQVLSLYHRGLDGRGLDHVMFGHIGNNHLHVNILPRSLDEYEAGKALYLEWAEAVVGMGGTVSAEHGIGKLKVALLRTMYGADGIEQMRAVKRLFDPEGMLNRGNLF